MPLLNVPSHSLQFVMSDLLRWGWKKINVSWRWWANPIHCRDFVLVILLWASLNYFRLETFKCPDLWANYRKSLWDGLFSGGTVSLRETPLPSFFQTFPPRYQTTHLKMTKFTKIHILFTESEATWAAIKTLVPFHYSGWWIGILTIVYCYPYITGQYNLLGKNLYNS